MSMLAASPAPPIFRDSRLAPVWDKVRSGIRLSREDGLLLFETEDLHAVGRMANFVKSQRHGEQVFFVLNRYVNPTNVCVLSCSFCDFARKKGEEGAFENSIEDVLDMIKPGTREAHIVGGHHPDWPFDYYERMI
ncbi:MAG TPA: aminofutalosine synthase MqnE, partial [Methylomirabilota bacterium]